MAASSLWNEPGVLRCRLRRGFSPRAPGKQPIQQFLIQSFQVLTNLCEAGPKVDRDARIGIAHETPSLAHVLFQLAVAIGPALCIGMFFFEGAECRSGILPVVLELLHSAFVIPRINLGAGLIKFRLA